MAETIDPVANARVAAGLVYKNEFVAFGICQHKTHPFQAQFGRNKNSIFLHAETDCIKNSLKCLSLKQLARSTLYIARAKYESCNKRHFTGGLAKPCPGCFRAICTYNINNVVYTLDNEGYEKL